jgi:YesN/AraC family two-component response regulator
MSMKVLIADDHQIIREGLRSLLEKQPGVTIVGEAENGRNALRLVRELSPDVIVMDVSMPDFNGIDATTRIKAEFRGVKVIALSCMMTGVLSST